MDVIIHITIEGERMDQIAYHYYGDVSLVPLLWDHNPKLGIRRNYPAGLEIYVPIIEKQKSTDTLPPWLRK